MHDVRQTQHGNTGKPDQRDRAKKLADVGGAAFLHGKQAKQDQQGERDYRLLESGRDHLQAFHGGQDRDGWRDDTIAVKQTGTKNANQQQHAVQLWLVFDRLGCQRQHGHQAAFAVVVSAQHQGHIFQRNDDGQRPEEDRQDAHHVVGGKGDMSRAENFLDGVQHAGADVAIDHTNGAQGEGAQRRLRCCQIVSRRRQAAGLRVMMGRYFASKTPSIRNPVRRGRWPQAHNWRPAWPVAPPPRTCKSDSAHWHRV